MKTKIRVTPRLKIIQQLLEHNNQLLHASLKDGFLSFDTMNTCFSEYVDYSETPSVRIQNFHNEYHMLPDLLRLLTPYCDEFIRHPGVCYQYDSRNLYINVEWVRRVVERVGYLYMRKSSPLVSRPSQIIPFSGDYVHVNLAGGQYVFNFLSRDWPHSKNMMNILALFQVFITDCLNGEKLYGWFHYYVCFLLFCLLSVLVSGDMKHATVWCNPRFSHRYAPLVFYSLQEVELSGLQGVVELNKSLLDWWDPITSFYEDIVKICEE